MCDIFFSSRRRHTRCLSDWSSDVCSSDLGDGAAETAREIAEAGGTAKGYAVDITERAALAEVVRRVESEVGPVDICVNNAGFIYTVGQLKDMSDEDWDLNLKINLTGTY